MGAGSFIPPVPSAVEGSEVEGLTPQNPAPGEAAPN